MREVPRQLPFLRKLSILTSGSFFWVGISFFLSGMVFLGLSGWTEARWEILGATVFFIVWGIGLMIYTLRSNWKKLYLFTWGKLYMGLLTQRKKSFSDHTGTVYFDCHFTYDYHRKNYNITLTIADAQELEEKRHYPLFLNDSDPQIAVCLFQFPRKVIRHFMKNYRSQVRQTQRNQGLEPTSWGSDQSV